MALDTAAEWQQRAEDWVIEKLKSGTVPAKATEGIQDPDWWRVFGMYAQANMADESVDFLDAVDEFKRSNDMGKAQEIYTTFVATSAPRQVNLYSGNLEALQAIFEADEVLGSLDMFDDAYTEVLGTLDLHTYRTFVGVATKVGGDLKAGGDVGISRPQQVELTRDQIDMTVVDNYNEWALKALAEGFSTNVYQLDDLVIIAGPMPTDEQPYVKWIRAQDGQKTGMLTMKAKGSGFSSGSLSMQGAQNKDHLKRTISRVSKKKVVFED